MKIDCTPLHARLLTINPDGEQRRFRLRRRYCIDKNERSSRNETFALRSEIPCFVSITRKFPAMIMRPVNGTKRKLAYIIGVISNETLRRSFVRNVIRENIIISSIYVLFSLSSSVSIIVILSSVITRDYTFHILKVKYHMKFRCNLR